MWQANIGLETEDNPPGGVAPLRSNLALYHYRQKAKERERGDADDRHRRARAQNHRTGPYVIKKTGEDFWVRALAILGFDDRTL